MRRDCEWTVWWSVMCGRMRGAQLGSAASSAPTFKSGARLLQIQNDKKKKSSRGPHRVNARQLHADVDHHDGEDLPADTAVCEQTADRQGLDRGERALLLLHLLHLSLDVPFFTEPLQGCRT